MSEITIEAVRKLLDTIDAGLVKGLGKPIPGQMCVQAAICYALGLPHSDDTGGDAPSLGVVKITLNDAGWSSPEVRAKGMRRLALASLGSVGALDEVEFVRRLAKMTDDKIVPIAKAATAKAAAAYTNAANAAKTVYYATKAAADAAAYAANAANAANAVNAVGDSVNAAKAARAAVLAASAATAAEADKVLAFFAEDAVQILIEMDVPGCRWLSLTEV